MHTRTCLPDVMTSSTCSFAIMLPLHCISHVNPHPLFSFLCREMTEQLTKGLTHKTSGELNLKSSIMPGELIRIKLQVLRMEEKAEVKDTEEHFDDSNCPEKSKLFQAQCLAFLTLHCPRFPPPNPAHPANDPFWLKHHNLPSKQSLVNYPWPTNWLEDPHYIVPSSCYSWPAGFLVSSSGSSLSPWSVIVSLPVWRYQREGDATEEVLVEQYTQMDWEKWGDCQVFLSNIPAGEEWLQCQNPEVGPAIKASGRDVVPFLKKDSTPALIWLWPSSLLVSTLKLHGHTCFVDNNALLRWSFCEPWINCDFSYFDCASLLLL